MPSMLGDSWGTNAFDRASVAKDFQGIYDFFCLGSLVVKIVSTERTLQDLVDPLLPCMKSSTAT